MTDYIEREDAIEAMENRFADIMRTHKHRVTTGEKAIASDMIEIAKMVKSADVAPIRYGHWIEDQDRIVCSECGARFKDEIIYMQENKPGAPHRCLECGAIMDKEVSTNG